MKIIVQLVREVEPDIPSRAVMLKDKCNYSHILIKYFHEGDKIFHATGIGVHTLEGQDVLDYYKSHIVVHEFELSLNVAPEYFLGFVRGMKGHDYGFDQIAKIAVNSEADNGDENYICSELVGIVMQEMCGINMDRFGDRDVWKPIHCYQALTT